MQDNQKTFAVIGKDGKILPHFIAVANLESKDPASVARGNEKVIRPRFADAEFFWRQDQKHRLQDYLPRLEKVIYQEQLGSLADKSRRLKILAEELAAVTAADPAQAAAAAVLSKCDLLSEMVMEFPELQGIMGRYYAQKEGLAEEIAQALEEQYFPQSAGAALPSTRTGLTLAIAEKLDTLVGGFAISAKPTGSKDPYALRRAAIGLIRLILENRLPLPLTRWLERSAAAYPAALQAAATVGGCCDYILERLQGYYREQGIAAETYQAVRALRSDDLPDIDARIRALHAFLAQPHAHSLLQSAKRIRNILKKNGENPNAVDTAQFTEQAEKGLWTHWQALAHEVETACAARDYDRALSTLGTLAPPLETFFAEVMVMADDERLKNNRLAMLTVLQQGFAHIADLSLIAG